MAPCRSRPADWPMSTARWRVVSQNVANAGTPGYAAEIATQRSLTADGAGPRRAQRPGDPQSRHDAAGRGVQPERDGGRAAYPADRACSRSTRRRARPARAATSPACWASLQDQFSTLLNDPASAPQQSQVVWAATTLAQGINALSDAYTTQRQAAQDNIGTELATLNTTLGTIGGLSNKIVDAEGGRPEHRRSGEPARRRAGRPVATARREGAGAAERRSDGRHRPPASCCRSMARQIRSPRWA